MLVTLIDTPEIEGPLIKTMMIFYNSRSLTAFIIKLFHVRSITRCWAIKYTVLCHMIDFDLQFFGADGVVLQSTVETG